MLRTLFWVLLVANLLFFAVMQWGAVLRSDPLPPVQAEVQPEKLRILDEAPARMDSAVTTVSAVAASAVAESAVPQPTPAQSLAPHDVLRCFDWGEFSGSDLARADKALAALPLGNSLKRRTVEYSHGYWVFMGPFKSRELAERKVQQLKARGVDDYYLVQEAGPWQNTISLGVFKTEEVARRHLAQLGEKGVRSAMVGERESHLKFTVFMLGPLNEALAAEVQKLQTEFPGSEFKEVSCNS